jgi:hypothetical protein
MQKGGLLVTWPKLAAAKAKVERQTSQHHRKREKEE